MSFQVDYSVYEKGGKKAPQYKIGTDLRGELTLSDFLAYAKLTLISIALNAFDEEKAQGFPSDPVIVVDNKPNRAIADVNALGKISFIRKASLDKVLMEIYNGLLSRSPKDSGTYIAGHFVMVGKVIVATSLTELEKYINSGPEIKDGEFIRFVNMNPYAGKLERDGISQNGSGWKLRKSTDPKKRNGEFVRRPNGAYYLTTRAISKKYRFNAPVKFEFLPGSQLDFSRAPRSPTKWTFRRTFDPNRRGQKYSGTYVYPTIRLQVRAGGLIVA